RGPQRAAECSVPRPQQYHLRLRRLVRGTANPESKVVPAVPVEVTGERAKGKIAHLEPDRRVEGPVAPTEHHEDLAGIEIVDSQILPAISVEVPRYGRDGREARGDRDGLLEGPVPPA